MSDVEQILDNVQSELETWISKDLIILMNL